MGHVVGIIIVLVLLIVLTLTIKGIIQAAREARKKPPRERIRTFLSNFSNFLLDITGIGFLIAITIDLSALISRLIAKIRKPRK